MPSSRSSRRARPPGRVAAAVAVAGTIALSTALATVGGDVATASSHREAPLIAADPAVDNTDVYAFVSPDKPDYGHLRRQLDPVRRNPTAARTSTRSPTDADYNINIDNDGDAKAGRRSTGWTFRTEDRRGNDTFLYNNGPVTSLDDENLLFRQTYTLESSISDGGCKTGRRAARSRRRSVGQGVDAGLRRRCATRRSTTCPAAARSTPAQADDPFFLDLRVFDLLYGGDLTEVGQDTLAGYNVNTIALQVPLDRRRAQRRRRAQPGDRRLERPPSATRCSSRRQGHAGRATRSRSPAWATRWSTRSWCRPASRTRSTR